MHEQSGIERRFVVFKGNEDMWFVRKLVELRDTHLASSLGQELAVRLAPREVNLC